MGEVTEDIPPAFAALADKLADTMDPENARTLIRDVILEAARAMSAELEAADLAAAKACTIDRARIVAGLEARGARRSVAAQYADAFLEYREASANIAANGSMVLHPRTANPIANPYLELRDRALLKLQKMRGVPADWLW
jgi:hypothetical protein